MTDVIVPGYTHYPMSIALPLKKRLEENKKEVIVLDLFEEERKKWLFKQALISGKSFSEVLKTVDQRIEEIGRIETLFTHSYGAVSILSNSLNAESYILIAPPLDKPILKPKEKFFAPFLPGFREFKTGYLQACLFAKLMLLDDKKKTILYSHNDERVSYGLQSLEDFSKVAELISFEVSHKQFMNDPEMLTQLLHI